MLDKLQAVEARYEKLMSLISDPAVQADPASYRTHTKALSDIQETVETYRVYRGVMDEKRQAEELAGDPDMADLAREELAQLNARIVDLEASLRVLMTPKDPNDEKNILLEIRAGTGGDEAALFAGDLFRMYSRFAERQGWRLEIMSQSVGDAGGIKDVVALIEGKRVYSRLKYESGVHRVQRVPATEASGRIHTSTATVAVLPEAEEVDVKIEEKDLRIDVYRSSGAGGLKEVIASIEGRGVYSRLKYESGVHRVQRVPATEASGRIHTSTATVAVLPEAEEVDIQIQDKDLRIDTFCSSGPGGQSVNTTYSAVRITHLPTNLVVSQQDEKSQIKNRAKALKVLRSRLYEIEMQKQHDAIAKDRRSQVGTGERSEKIRTYNFRESRITDHRINFTTHQLMSVLDGELGELIDVVTSHYQAEALKNASSEPERDPEKTPA